MDFDVIPYEDIVWGHRLGAGSFGSVYKGSYLGIDIAIKEVLPSTEYDVHKYFEREWRIMRECRHPNIVLFLGLSKAPEDHGRVFIISEYIPSGNLRQFLLSPSRPFPWRLRLSFGTDVARAVAYLHARQCIHRDLKGENLLITSNERVKVTDFGFARIASRNAEEMRRMTYCGTDGYMSPEIINGHDFDLPTDVFSLGIILIEIMSRKLVDAKTYIRQAPSWTPDPSEVKQRASPGCPPALISLALDCTLESPTARPTMPQVLLRLREIELDVLARLPEAGSEHVGSIKLVHHGGKRAMPIWDLGAGEDEEEEREGKMEEEALRVLEGLDVGGSGAAGGADKGTEKEETWRTARWEDQGASSSFGLSRYEEASEMRGHEPLLASAPTSSSLAAQSLSGDSARSTDMLGTRPMQAASAFRTATPPDEDDFSGGSAMTIRGAEMRGLDTAPGPPVPVADPVPIPASAAEEKLGDFAAVGPPQKRDAPVPPASEDVPMSSSPESQLPPPSEIETIPSLASSTVGASPVPLAPLQLQQIPGKLETKFARVAEEGSGDRGRGTHRFTLVSKEAAALMVGGGAVGASKKPSGFASNFAFAFLPRAFVSAGGGAGSGTSAGKAEGAVGGGGGVATKCPVCHRRIGQRAALQCDDCAVLVHVKCSHAAARDCGGGPGEMGVVGGKG